MCGRCCAACSRRCCRRPTPASPSPPGAPFPPPSPSRGEVRSTACAGDPRPFRCWCWARPWGRCSTASTPGPAPLDTPRPAGSAPCGGALAARRVHLHRPVAAAHLAGGTMVAVLTVRARIRSRPWVLRAREGHMRNRMSVVLMAIAMGACHPRYVPLDERGVGGAGGLDSIRTWILAAIAMRDYQHARDLLELAANMSEEEQGRFEQMISAP